MIDSETINKIRSYSLEELYTLKGIVDKKIEILEQIEDRNE